MINELTNWFNGIIFDNSFLSDIASFESVLIGVFIPISLDVVFRAIKEYKDPEIAFLFKNEKLFKGQIFLFLPNVVLAITLSFLSVKNPIILGLIFNWFVINVIIFYLFFDLTIKYVAETHIILIKKLKKHAENIFKKNSIRENRQQFFFLYRKIN